MSPHNPVPSLHLPVIDCADRYPVCGSRCCYLEVRLTDEELAGGSYHTNPERPHYLERTVEGHCVYFSAGPRSCNHYEARPTACRNFTCEGDIRFWRDFERRIPNVKAQQAILNLGRMPPRAD